MRLSSAKKGGRAVLSAERESEYFRLKAKCFQLLDENQRLEAALVAAQQVRVRCL